MADSSTMKWSLPNLRTAYNALNMANGALTGHLTKMIAGTTFTMASQAQCLNKNGDARDCYSGKTNDTGITYYSSSSNLQIPLTNFLHEIGHLIDAVPATLDTFSNPLRPETKHPTWVDSAGYVDSNLVNNNLIEPIQAKPMNEPNSANEWWADAFANYVAHNINVNEASGAGSDMYDYVHDALQPYTNP